MKRLPFIPLLLVLICSQIGWSQNAKASSLRAVSLTTRGPFSKEPRITLLPLKLISETNGG